VGSGVPPLAAFGVGGEAACAETAGVVAAGVLTAGAGSLVPDVSGWIGVGRVSWPVASA
jgi:hypothetical protein